PPAVGGTQRSPLPLGTAVTFPGGLQATLNSVDLDATDEVAAANSFNDPPEAGKRYILLNVTLTNGSEKPVSPAVAVSVEAVGSGNVVHSITSAFAVAPEPLSGQQEMFPGGSVTGNVALAVPHLEVEDSSLLVMMRPV